MLETPVLVASNGGTVRVRSNGEGSKAASAPDRAVEFKKQRRAPASMCGRKNGSSFADTGPAFELALMLKTLKLIFTSKLAN